MTVSVLWLFLAVSLVGLRCVSVVFYDHTHLLFVMVVDEYFYVWIFFSQFLFQSSMMTCLDVQVVKIQMIN